MCNNRIKFVLGQNGNSASSDIRQLGERMRIRSENSCGLTREDEIKCALICEKLANLLDGEISAQ